MSAVYDMIEISGLDFNSDLTVENGGLVGIVDDADKQADPGDPPEEFNNGDIMTIGGSTYEIGEIWITDDGTTSITSEEGTTAIADRSNDFLILDLVDTTTGEHRYFIVPGDRLGDLTNISSIRLGDFRDAPGNDHVVPSGADNEVTICFVAGTRIATRSGEVAVEDLRPGQLVQTVDDGLQPVRWIGVQTIPAARLRATPQLAPVLIRAGALGEGLPLRDLRVSPNHRMLLRSRIAQRMFGQSEVLVAAKFLTAIPGIDIDTDAETVTYVHFLLNDHQIVFAEGSPSETLFTGRQAMRTLLPDQLSEIRAIFPQIDCEMHDHLPVPARHLVQGRLGRKLVARHLKNEAEFL